VSTVAAPQDVLLYDPVHKLTAADKELIWSSRYQLSHYPDALPKFMLSVVWSDAECVREAHRLLHVWNAPAPAHALQVRWRVCASCTRVALTRGGWCGGR
jgi:hypothetical protein